MKAVLLAAGLGTRLRPLTNKVPKCLVPIHGKPLLGHWVDLLLNDGIEQIVVNTHYLTDQVEQFVADSPWRERLTLAHEPILLGTGGTILENRKVFSDEAFLVAHADNLTRFDVSSLKRRHTTRPEGVEITMMTFRTDVPENCGIVEEDEQGIVTAFHEKVGKPPGDLANGAVYIFEPTVVDFLDSLGKRIVDLSTEVLPDFIGRIVTFHNTDYHRDIGTLESLNKAQAEF